MPRFVTLMQRSHKKSLSDFRSRWKSQGFNFKFLSVTIVKLTTILTQGKKNLVPMTIISVKIYLSKLVTRTWGSAPPPYLIKVYQK